MNIVHRIPPEKLAQSVADKVQEAERFYSTRCVEIDGLILQYEAATDQAKKRWRRIPSEEQKIGERAFADKCILREREYYSTVRVVEMPKSSPRSRKKRFLLVYGPQDDQSLSIDGTGPFETYARAEFWFLNGGR